MKVNSRITTKILAILLLSFAAIVIVSVFVGGYLENTFSQSSIPSLVISACDVLVAGVAALFIVIQLKGEADNELKQYQTEQARFLLEYNHAFITNPEMTSVERNLECNYLGEGKQTLDFYDEEKGDRQKLINYLVYLEGFAACVLNGLLELETIDDLFAYRFFLAMNSPVAQNVEIKPFAIYYRGSLKLYAKWYLYRKEKWDQWDHVDYGIPQMEHSIHQWDRFEEFVEHPIRLEKAKSNEKSWIALIDGKEAGYSKAYTNIDDIKHEMFQVSSEWAGSETEYWIRNALGKKLKEMITSKLKFKQLSKGNLLSEHELRDISRLIYETDPYIYPAMFGNIENAQAIIPKVLLDGNDRMFSFDNIFCCKMDDEIVGIILWCQGALHWKADNVLNVANEMGIYVNKNSLCLVEKEYIQDNYNEDHLSISIVNVCIKDNLQGYGIGYQLLQVFINQHVEVEMNLCVLANNYGAIKVYKKCGFEIIGEIREGFSLEDDKPDCVDMKRSA